MRRKLSFYMGLLLLTGAGCAVENHRPSYPPAVDPGSSSQSAQPASSAVAEAMDSPATLAQCIQIALKNNPQVVGGGWDIATAQAEKEVAAGQRWPSLALQGSYTRYLDDQRLVMPRYGNEPGVYGDDILAGEVVLRMPLYTAGRIKNEIAAADLLQQSARHRLARTRQELVFNVSQVFYNILAQRHIIESLEFSQKALQEHHKRVSDLLSVQKAARVDLLRTEVRLADLNQRLVAERNVLSVLHRVLINFLGLSSPAARITVKGDLQIVPVDANVTESVAEAYAHRADYLAIQRECDAQARRLAIARAGHWPVVSLEGTYGLRSAADPSSHPAGTDDTEDVGYVGVSAVIPIAEGGRIAAGIRREHAKLNSLRQRLRKLELQIQLDVDTATLNISSSRERITATEKSIEQARESLRVEREKYDLGKGSITDVLDAQAALLDAQTTYYHTLADYNSAVAQWHLALGEE